MFSKKKLLIEANTASMLVTKCLDGPCSLYILAVPNVNFVVECGLNLMICYGLSLQS